MQRIIWSLVLFSVTASMAADVLMESNTGEGELVRIENTGSGGKIGLVIENTADLSEGIQVTSNSSGVMVTAGPGYPTVYELYGIKSDATADEPAFIAGVRGTAAARVGSDIHGGSFNAMDSSGEGFARGVSGVAESYVGTAYGVYGSAYSAYGLQYAGYFDGEVSHLGLTYASDQKLKKNIRDLEGGLQKVLALKPKLYEMRVDEYKGRMNLRKGEQMGFLAQDVETVLPQLVKDGVAPAHLSEAERKNKVKKEPTKYKALDYEGIIPVLVAAVQEQQALIEALWAEVQYLKTR